MNLFLRNNIREANYTKYKSNVDSILRLEWQLNAHRNNRQMLCHKMQLAASFNLIAIALSVMVDSLLKIAIIVPSLLITSYKFFGLLKEIRSCDKEIKSITEHIANKVDVIIANESSM